MTEYDSISGRKFLLASKVQNWHGNLLCSIRWLRASQNDAGAARPQQQHESASTEKRKARRNGRHCCDPSERPTWMRSVDHQSVLHAPTANHRRSGSHAGQVALAGGHPQSLQGSFHWHSSAIQLHRWNVFLLFIAMLMVTGSLLWRNADRHPMGPHRRPLSAQTALRAHRRVRPGRVRRHWNWLPGAFNLKNVFRFLKFPAEFYVLLSESIKLFL